MLLRRLARSLAAIVALTATGPAFSQAYVPPAHEDTVPLYARMNQYEAVTEANRATTAERNRDPAWLLAEHRRLTTALAGLKPQTKGTVDAHVVAVGTDSDPVFGREAREAARVLSRRYNAAGRTVTLAMSDGSRPSDLPRGSPDNIGATLARVAELMDKNEDVLVLYTTGHGAPIGLAYNDGSEGFGVLGPDWLRRTLDSLGIKRRVLLLSACYSGIFIAPLSSPDTAIVTAASSDRTSFGCFSDNDWTFFGDALINHALRKPTKLSPAVEEARKEIAGWESREQLTPSQPSVMIGGAVDGWLTPLEARIPAGATKPVGRPSAEALTELSRLKRRN